MSVVERDLRRNLPKHALLQHTLRARLRGVPAGALLPSIAALRAEFGVAQATVDRALRELRHEGLIEVRHGSGCYATGRVQLLSVALYFAYDVLAEQFGVFPRLLLRGLMTAGAASPDVQLRHYLLMGAGEPWANRLCALTDDVRRGLVDGVVAVGAYGHELDNLAVPVLAFRRVPHVAHQVDLDYRTLLTQGVVAAAAQGVQRVAFLGPRLAASTTPATPEHPEEQRLPALFMRLAAQHGLRTRPDWVGCDMQVTAADDAIHHGRQAMHAWCTAPGERPDGVVSIDDYLTTGALQAVAANGLRAGRDVHVFSHTNRGSPILAGAPVTRLEFDPTEVGAVLLRRVRELIAGRHGEHSLVTVPTHVMVAGAK